MAKFVEFWRRSLKRRPIITNMVVFAMFYSAAEMSQQTFQKMYGPDHPDMDFAAGARIVGTGSLLYAPTLYVWYKYLDNKFPGNKLRTVATKVACDQFFMTPVLMAIFYTILGILERKEDVFEYLRTKYWKTFIANQCFWIPGQTINFYLVPPNLRVVYVAAAAIIWINILCYIKRQKVVQ